jgi:hypothetical protein
MDTLRLKHKARPRVAISNPKGGTHAHRLVVSTAIEMAHEMYDMLMLDNEQWGNWKARYPSYNAKQLEAKFCVLMLPQVLPQARATLAGMLGRGDISEHMKSEIYEALLADNTLTHGRRRPIDIPEIK